MRVSARAAARAVAIRDDNGIPRDAALRVARGGEDDASPSLHIGFVAAPELGDQVAESNGLRYCVEDALSPMLDHVTLDVEPGGDDALFVLRESDPDSNGQQL